MTCLVADVAHLYLTPLVGVRTKILNAYFQVKPTLVDNWCNTIAFFCFPVRFVFHSTITVFFFITNKIINLLF